MPSCWLATGSYRLNGGKHRSSRPPVRTTAGIASIPPPPAWGGNVVTCRVRALAAGLGLGLAAVLAVFAAAPAAAQSVSIISTPANGTHYVLGEEIRTRISHGQVFGVAGGAWNTIHMRINIGGTVRQASIREGYRVRATVHTFRYTVTQDDVDTDGITIPANSIGGPTWRSFGFGTVNRDHGALNNQAAHKVIGSEARVTSSNPGWLTWPTLNTATVTVTLTGSTFGSSVAASNFTINASPAITGLSVTNASATSGEATATLTLGYTGSTTLTGDRTFTVTVAGAAHEGTLDLTTNAMTVGTIPTPTLAISPTSIAENGGVATVTATLDKTLIQPVTVTATAEAGTNAAAGDFTQTGTTLTFPAGTTASTGLITLTAVDDDTDGPDKTVRVTGSSASGSQARSPSDATMTITDDDAAPTPTLVLSATSISENGGTATVTARLSHPSVQPTTVTLAAAAQGGLQASDYTQAGSSTLTIAAGATTTTDNRRITAVDNDVDAPDKSLRISATVANGHGAGTAQNVTLTFTDDEATPTAALALSASSISENGGVATVTATLSGTSSEAVTLTVATTAVSPAAQADFTRTGSTLTIAAGTTTSAGLVTVTAVDNSADAPDKSVTVAASAAGGNGVAAPSSMTLAIPDDDAAPGVTLALNPASIAEPSGVSTVTATLSHPSSAPSTVTVTPVSGAYTVGTDATITIAAGSTTAASDTVLITVVDDDLHHGNAGRGATVTAALTNGQGAGAVTGAALTITDDENLPTASLLINPLSSQISENGGIATITAQLAGLSGKSSEATTVTVTVTAVASSGAVAGDFTQTGTTLTVAAGSLTSTGLVTVTGVDNNVDAANKLLRISATAAGGNGIQNPGLTVLTLTDDEAAPTATLVLTPSTILENGGISTVTAKLSHPTTTGTVTLTVTTTAVSPTVAADFTQSSTDTLTIAASATTSTGLVTVTAVDNNVATGNKQVRVAATAAGGGVAAPSAATLILRDDEFGLSESAVIGQATEAGGTATFTVQLNTQPSAAVTVAVSSRDASEGTVSPPSLTFTTQNWSTAQTVTVTGVQDTIDDGTVTWQVRLDPSSGDSDYNAVTDVDVDVTTTDDDGPPGVTLALNPSSIAESGTGNVATVTARLSHASGAATTVTVTAVSGFYAAGTDAAIVIPAEATTAASDTATVVAVDNDTDAPDRTETVTASITNARAAADSTTMAVTGASLTVRDDDAAPGAVLFLSPSSISENRGIATVAAVLSRTSSEPSTVTVTAVSGSYTVGSNATLTIAAGSTVTSDTATVTAVDDAIHQGSAGRSATVTGTLANGQGAGAVTGAALTLTDDETLPVATLVLGPASISEEGGVSTVAAALSGPSSAAVTVTVAAAPGTGAVAADFSLSTATTLTIAAGSTTSAGTVTVTAVGNAVAAGSKQVTVSGTSAGGNSVVNPADVTLTITDDDTPRSTLVLSSSSIAENGGVATVTATLDRQSTVAVTVTVAAAAGANTAAGDFTLSTATTLTFAANATTSTGLVTVTAVNNTTDAPNKSVTVSGTASDSLGLTNTPPDVTLAITDDEAAPGVVLSLNPSSVAENGGASVVSATLSHPSSQPSTVTVTAVSGAYTVGSDATITIAAGSTTAASDTAAIAGVDDDVHQGSAGRSVTVTATLANGQGAGAVTGASLTLTDDETLPTASLVLGPASISENGGVSTVTVTLTGPSSQATTLTVSSAAVASSGAVAADFTQTGTTLTIAAGSTTSAGTVTVRGNDNNVDAANKSVTVSATAAGGNGVAAPSAEPLTLTDDEDTATATLVLTPSAILENGEVSTVTARLSHPTTEATTLTVSAAPVSPAVAGDFTLSATTTLTLAAGATASTGVVTVTAVDNAVASGRKRVTVSATAAGGRMVAAPSSATLIIRDDEFGLDESAVSGGPVTEGGGTATFTVALQTQPSAAVTVSVTRWDADGLLEDASEGRVEPSSLVFTVQNWETAQTVTVTGLDDDVDDGDVAWKVRLDPSSGDVNYDGLDPVDVDVSTEDNDDAPTVTLELDPSSISEAGGVSTVTATLSHPSSAETAVTVSVAPGTGAVSGDYTLSVAKMLTIAAGGTTSTGLVTVTAVNNDVDAPDKTVTVSGRATNDGPLGDGMGAGAVESATLTITDDDTKGLAFSSVSVPPTDLEVLEVTAGEVETYTVKLTSEPSGPVTVAVTASPSDRVPVLRPATLTFPASDWDTAQTVTVRVTGNDGDYAAPLSLSHDASGSDYEDVAGSLDVSVEGETKVEVGDTVGETTYHIGGREVTVVVESGVPEGIELDLEALSDSPSDEPLKLTFAPEENPEPSNMYTYDSQGSRTVVDVEVEGTVPSAGLGLCLPVEGAVEGAAKERPLLLLHHDGRDGSAWEVVARLVLEDTPDGGRRGCADKVRSFSSFAVGYEDTKPVLEDFTQTTWVFTVDEAIEPVELPEATGGDGDLNYELSPALPEGLTREGRVLSGTPTEEFDETTYTWTVTDLDGESQKDERTFTIKVKAAIGPARARLKAINESILPEVSRASWSSAMDALSRRLGSSAGGGGGGSGASGGGLSGALAGFVQSNGPALQEGGASWKELWSGQSFATGLGGGGEGAGGGRPVTVWGSGERRNLSRETPSLKWSGELFATHLGADVGFGSGLTGGAGVSWYESGMDYTDRSGDDGPVAGVHRSRMASVQPYVGWSSGSGSRLWGALGYGSGEVEIVDAALLERFGRQKSDSKLLAAAAGGALRVSPGGGALRLDLKGEAQATRYEVEENGDLIEGLSVRTHRLRFSTEGTREYVLSGGGRVLPSAELGVRWDGGDGVTGAGVEVGGGVSWSDAGGRLTLEARGRALAAHRGELDEWGMTGGVRLAPRVNGRGLSLSVAPVWGSAGSGTARLWEEGVAGRPLPSGGRPDGAGLDAELGYGMGAFGGFGVGTPYLRYGQAPEGERRYGLGWRLARPAGGFELDLEGWRRERGTLRPDHGLGLELRVSW